MKLCITCSQALAESVRICPNCGTEVTAGLSRVDTYRILEVVHEGQASILCRAIADDADSPVALRLFTADSGVDDKVAARLRDELEPLSALPAQWFVQHHSINCSPDGKWYRISEWIEAERWGSLLSSGRLDDPVVAYSLFQRLAAILSGLHQSGHFIPHLILNDILVLKGDRDPIEVKLDYKLSRFLDPKMARPGPMLHNLLGCHPDIGNGRPLDYKSDIWSLGRVFAQILSADLDIGDPRPLLKEEQFPHDISVLIRSMLADDPDLRPGSMRDVAETLERLKEEAARAPREAGPETAREVKRLRRAVVGFGLMLTVLLVTGGLFFFIRDRPADDSDRALESFARSYAGSVAFVMVQYRIRVGDTVVYSQIREGTAFLVDPQGYLLTNRHVACPWLEDDMLFTLIQQIRKAGRPVLFDYRLHLWFEGDRAFNRLVGIGAGSDVEDIYDLGSGYGRGGERRVTIAGVARPQERTDQKIRAPLQDDFAVLKINRVPPGLQPLPLDRDFDIDRLERLSPVIALGFPLGSTIQADVINVSVTRGHIRRTFSNFFQVDTSIYKGNSGGPIIDRQGRVIGIASAVATDVAQGPMTVVTPLSDIGLVLPVTEAVQLLDELKAGHPKWNGVLDLSATDKHREITDLALTGNWGAARRLAEQSLEGSDSPSLVMAAAVMRYCAGDLAAAAELLEKALSIDPDNYEAQLLHGLIATTAFQDPDLGQLQRLASLDWRSPGEFYGFLARQLSGGKADEATLAGWNTLSEKSWIHYLGGVIMAGRGEAAAAAELFRSAARAAGRDDWPRYLALAALARSGAVQPPEITRFGNELRELEAERAERSSWIEPLVAKFRGAAADPAARRDLLLQIRELQPENRLFTAYASFYSTMAEDWLQALNLAEEFLARQGREEPLRLAAGLLVPALLERLEQAEEGSRRLERYCGATGTVWYQQICETLLGRRTADELLEKAGTTPEKVLTAAVALGFRAEAEGDRERALRYYREALGSYLDTWIEFELARQRYLRLRQGAGN